MNQFYNNKESKDGKNWVCKDCSGIRTFYHGKGIRRFCIGIKCRGEKKFMSYAGARLCPECKRAIAHTGELYSSMTITYKRKGAIN